MLSSCFYIKVRPPVSPEGAYVIDRIRETLGGAEPSIVATGPNAPVIARYCRNHVVYDKYLLMEGLYAIYQKNAK